ncbi:MULTISPECIES: alpha/beta fold hydrolase [Psychrobacter]|uniref:alpha/beta fold hydrolase n=1 Tax=Psychrobacter TaxID=497 RepID=UPI000ECDBBE6|nr:MULTISPECIES: alpha/beta hydrolase [Psychrobacter]HCT73227.1 alpha/beta hydrolase [Psychrobacter sp.]
MQSNLLALLANYQLKTIDIALTDGTLLPVSVIGSGKPVILLHAYGMDAREFLPFILPLVGKYAFYLPHLRGFGAAKDIDLTQFDFVRQYADDISVVIEQICLARNISSLPVAAISMGAQVMWAYFERYGCTKVSRYLNIDQSPAIHNQANWQGGLFGARQQEVFDIFHDVINRTLPYAETKSFAHLPFSLKRHATDVERLFSLLSVNRTRSKAFIQVMTYKNDPKLALYKHSIWHHKMRCLQAYLTLPYDFRGAIERVTIPVVNLIGGRSKLYDAKWQQQVTQMLPNAREVVLPRSGHAVPMDEPIGFYKVLKGFLQD